MYNVEELQYRSFHAQIKPEEGVGNGGPFPSPWKILIHRIHMVISENRPSTALENKIISRTPWKGPGDAQTHDSAYIYI